MGRLRNEFRRELIDRDGRKDGNIKGTDVHKDGMKSLYDLD